jgi:hypothetical protein
MFQSWNGLLNDGGPAATGAGTALSTATTAALSPQNSAGQDYAWVQQPAQFNGWRVGLVIAVKARGILTTTATSTTATIFLRANKTNSGSTFVTLATPNGITTGTTVVTGIQWELEAEIRCTAIASSGNTVSTKGKLILGNSGAALPANPIALTGTAGIGPLFMPNSAGETAAAVDTTVSQGIQVAGTLAGANATIQVDQWFCNIVN